MTTKPRTPAEIARKKKKTFSYSLEEANANRLAKVAADHNVPASELVNEAIRYYLEAVLDKKK